MTAMNQYATKLEITPHNEWAQRFWDGLLPEKERVSKHPLFLDMASGSLSLECFRSALLNFYPLVYLAADTFERHIKDKICITRNAIFISE